jgi:hypothetical protein
MAGVASLSAVEQVAAGRIAALAFEARAPPAR